MTAASAAAQGVPVDLGGIPAVRIPWAGTSAPAGHYASIPPGQVSSRWAWAYQTGGARETALAAGWFSACGWTCQVVCCTAAGQYLILTDAHAGKTAADRM